MNHNHTPWCARGHHCNLGEHRSAPIVVAIPGAGRAVLTRIRTGDQEHAELRVRVRLRAGDDARARPQLLTLLDGAGTLLHATRRAGRYPPTSSGRRAA